jgi:hypothetical protein
MPKYHLLRNATARLMLSAVICGAAILPPASGFAGGNPKDQDQGKNNSKGRGPKDHGSVIVTNVYNITNFSVYNVTNISATIVTNSYNITNTSLYNITNAYNLTNTTVYNVTNIYNVTNNGGVGAGGVMWIDHFSLLPGDSSVQTSFNAASSGVGAGLTGLVIQSTTTGDVATGGGDKVVQTAVQVPPGFNITRVRVCYELTSSSSFITQIRLAQVQNPPSQALINLEDPTDLTAVGPVCVNSAETALNPQDGAVLLSFKVNFGSTADKIVIRGVALQLAPAGANPGGGGPGV